MLDAKIACALNKIIQNSHFKKKVSLEEQKAQKEDKFQRGRQIAFMIYDYFRVTGAQDTVLDYTGSSSVTLRDDNVQEFDTRWDEILLSMSKIPSDDVLESLYKMRVRESDQLKAVLEWYHMKFMTKVQSPYWKMHDSCVAYCRTQSRWNLRKEHICLGIKSTSAILQKLRSVIAVRTLKN